MKRVFICPSARDSIPLFSERKPLVTVSFLGQSLLEYWLSHAACAGAKQVVILANDRPEEIRLGVGDGSRWGLQLKVLAESRELTASEALLKHESELDQAPASAASGISVLDHFPGSPEGRPLTGYAALFSAILKWMPHALTPDRVGVRELQSGIWADCHSVISPEAKLRAPSWIGKHVYVGPGAEIGPECVLEGGVFVEGHAELARSWIGAETFVGRFARLNESIALGSMLINWQTNSTIEVPDPFLLSALRRPRLPAASSWFARLAELYDRKQEEVSLAWKHLLVSKES